MKQTFPHLAEALPLPMAARQAPQVSLKSPYSVWTPSKENLRQVWPPPPAPHVVDTQSQSGEPDMATYRYGQNPQHRVILGRLQHFLWDTGGTLARKKPQLSTADDS